MFSKTIDAVLLSTLDFLREHEADHLTVQDLKRFKISSDTGLQANPDLNLRSQVKHPAASS